ncbi:primosomal protein N' [Legionella sp. km772]|uniref:primosomal protein N' n=1 Tax=Legionella sp. km772 TaxID=2498111 RepID=UPI000F8EE40D|nr:primosomal protein N' [Legionella sp. km772]RUR13109.1 primosomal protein N' [Legionella sp. km772]
MRRYKVCIPNTHRDFFDYLAGSCLPCIGARVWVPFRNQKKLGIVIDEYESSTASKALKEIVEVIDDGPLIDGDMLNLCLWIAQYYQSPLSEVIALALPKKYRLGSPCELPKTDCYQLVMPAAEALKQINSRASKQRALISWLNEQDQAITKADLSAQGFTSSQLLPLLELGLIELSQQIKTYEPSAASKTTKILHLNPEQEAAFNTIKQQLHHYHCFLLNGVTGSGKTEVYFHTINEVLDHHKQVLILVPEIGLTPQLLARFQERFQQKIAVIHSNLNESERQIAWQAAKENQVNIIIGTRAAIFTPMPHLGLIIIDEEHDTSFKQMDGVRYSARDTALMRAHRANIPIILGSATPSLESLYNCKQQKYTLLELPNKALTTTPLHYQIIDLRAQNLHEGLATPTLDVIKKHLANNNQVLVFINRRGFAPVVLCHQCGWIMDCKACDSHLTLHKQSRQMHCHHCGLSYRPPTQCLNCASQELIPVGVGTQRVHEYLSAYFPEVKVLRIDKDETRKKNAFAEQLGKITQGEAQLIVGTQMLAKGHHFPRLSLVVILDADAGFYNPDFRAIEHVGQLLTQVAGRAGRAEEAGEVLIQTHLPQHPLLNLLVQQGYEPFANALLDLRQEAALPPFHFLAVLRAQGKSPAAVTQLLLATKQYLQIPSLCIMGPAPAPLARKANQYRMQLLIKSASRPALKSALTQMREWLTMNKLTTGIRWNVDVDPMDLS